MRETAGDIVLGGGRTRTASKLLQNFFFAHETQHNFLGRESGWERRRLYLCTVLMQNPNFLILDEPTNDLDIMTLQVLEEYLQSFSGCVIIVSHDRYFMDKVADHLMIFEGEGRTKDFPSSYSDYLIWRALKQEQEQSTPKAKAQEPTPVRERRDNSTKLSFKEKREFEQIEIDLPQLEEQKTKIEEELSSGTLSVEELTQKSEQISQIIEQIDTLTMRWLELSERS